MRALRLHRACSIDTKQPFKTRGKAGLYTLNANYLMGCRAYFPSVPRYWSTKWATLKAESFWMFNFVLLYFKRQILLSAPSNLRVHSLVYSTNKYWTTNDKYATGTNLGSCKKVYKTNKAPALKELTILWGWYMNKEAKNLITNQKRYGERFSAEVRENFSTKSWFSHV